MVLKSGCSDEGANVTASEREPQETRAAAGEEQSKVSATSAGDMVPDTAGEEAALEAALGEAAGARDMASAARNVAGEEAALEAALGGAAGMRDLASAARGRGEKKVRRRAGAKEAGKGEVKRDRQTGRRGKKAADDEADVPRTSGAGLDPAGEGSNPALTRHHHHGDACDNAPSVAPVAPPVSAESQAASASVAAGAEDEQGQHDADEAEFTEKNDL